MQESSELDRLEFPSCSNSSLSILETVQLLSLGALWPTCGPFGTLWDLANCVTVVFGTSGLPLGTFKLCNCRLWEPLGTLKLCNCRPWEHCDPPRVPFTPFGTLLDAFVPHLAAFGPLPIHLCDVSHCITVHKALTKATAGPSGSPPLSL